MLTTVTPAHQKHQMGVSLIELIVVMLLIAILSTYAASRFDGGASMKAFGYQQQAIAIVRQIQLQRMQSNITNIYDYINKADDPRSEPSQRSLLYMRNSGNGNYFGDSYSYFTPAEEDYIANVEGLIITQAANTAATNSKAVKAFSDVSIRFNLLGQPIDDHGAVIEQGVKFIFNYQGDAKGVCINKEGFVYAC